jgi:hypothetical protein
LDRFAACNPLGRHEELAERLRGSEPGETPGELGDPSLEGFRILTPFLTLDNLPL